MGRVILIFILFGSLAKVSFERYFNSFARGNVTLNSKPVIVVSPPTATTPTNYHDNHFTPGHGLRILDVVQIPSA